MAIGLKHKGDLWYRISDGTTWYWNGTTWVQQDVPDEVFDKIDGKAQVFVSTPYTPYAVGDLWFNGTEDDIKTCIRARASGNYVESDWVKYNKYTDDSALENWVEVTYEADLEVTQRSIAAKVQKDQSGTKTSFGWVMNETSHIWYSNNQEVMKVNSSGLTVKGNVTATTGFIGTSQSGFEITSSAIRNGMTSLSDTTHNGVYIGTNGIALGQGKFTVTSGGTVTANNLNITGGSIKLGGTTSSPVFNVTSAGAVTASNLSITGGTIKLGGTSSSPVFQVTSAGAVTASNLSITGGSIKIGGTASSPTFNVTSSGAVTAKSLSLTGGSININDKFIVNSQGNLTAESGTFKGNVYAKNIQASASNPTYGTFDGSGITPRTISGGGSTGQIGQYTLNDYNTERVGGYGAYSSASFNSDVQGGLYGGTAFNKAIVNNAAEYPNYFTANRLIAITSVRSPQVLVPSTLSGEPDINLHAHYHSILVNDDGTVQFGLPINTRPNPFNIADTKTFKDGVKAVTVKSFGYETDDQGDIDYGNCYVTLAYNGETTRTVGNLDNMDALVWAYSEGLNDATVDDFNLNGNPGWRSYPAIGTANNYYIDVGVKALNERGQSMGTGVLRFEVTDLLIAAAQWGAENWGSNSGYVEITSTSGNSAFVKLYDSNRNAIPINGSAAGRWIDVGTSYPFG